MILGLVGGGCALVSMGAMIRRAGVGPILALITGIITIGWIVGEMLLLPTNLFTGFVTGWLQGAYLLVGLAMVVLALRAAPGGWRGAESGGAMTRQEPERSSDDALASTVTLPDGVRVPIRPISPDDAAALQAFHRGLSEQSVYLRFFAALPELADDRARYFAGADGRDRVALVALDPASPDTIIGVLRYDRLPGTDRAEYAAVITDRWQGRGLGITMSRHLIAIAQRRGIRMFIAFTPPENDRMRHLFRDLGFPEHTRWEAGTMQVEIDLTRDKVPPTPGRN